MKKTWPQNYLDHQNRGKSENVTVERSLKKRKPNKQTKKKSTKNKKPLNVMWYPEWGSLNNNKKFLGENRGIQILKDFT